MEVEASESMADWVVDAETTRARLPSFTGERNYHPGSCLAQEWHGRLYVAVDMGSQPEVNILRNRVVQPRLPRKRVQIGGSRQVL